MIDVCGGYAGSSPMVPVPTPSVPSHPRARHASVHSRTEQMDRGQLRPGKHPKPDLRVHPRARFQTSFSSHFMGAGENQVRFVAIALGSNWMRFRSSPQNSHAFEPGVVLASIPKVFYPAWVVSAQKIPTLSQREDANGYPRARKRSTWWKNGVV